MFMTMEWTIPDLVMRALGNFGHVRVEKWRKIEIRSTFMYLYTGDQMVFVSTTEASGRRAKSGLETKKHFPAGCSISVRYYY